MRSPKDSWPLRASLLVCPTKVGCTACPFLGQAIDLHKCLSFFETQSLDPACTWKSSVALTDGHIWPNWPTALFEACQRHRVHLHLPGSCGKHGCIMSPPQLHAAQYRDVLARQLLSTDLASTRAERCEGDKNLSFLLRLSDIYNRLIRGTTSFIQIVSICNQETCWRAMKSSVVWVDRQSHRGPGRHSIDFKQDHLRSATCKVEIGHVTAEIFAGVVQSWEYEVSPSLSW